MLSASHLETYQMKIDDHEVGNSLIIMAHTKNRCVIPDLYLSMREPQIVAWQSDLTAMRLFGLHHTPMQIAMSHCSW